MTGEAPTPEFRVLGPLEIRLGERVVPVGGAKQRTLLGLLLLREGEVVSVEGIVDELWPEAPPANAAQSVQMHVSRLRRALSAAGNGHALATRPSGYVIETGPEGLDLRRFETLVDRGRSLVRSGDHERARDALGGALALWRGDPLGGVVPGPALRSEVARLQEQRLSVQLERVHCDIALGRHAEVLGELEALARRYPMQERIRSLLMIALYRSGRQADALEVYRDTHRRMSDDLGLSPGDELKELQARILRRDPALLGGPRPHIAPDAPAPKSPLPAARSRRGRRAIAAALAVGAAACTALAITGLPGGDRGLGHVDAGAVGIMDPENGSITAQVAPGGRAVGLAAARDAVWVADADRGALVRVDPDEVHAVDTVPVGAGTAAVAAGEGSVWAVSSNTRTVAQIDPGSGTIVRRYGVGNGARAVAAGEGGVWVAEALDGTVSHVDPRAERVVARIPVGAVPSAVAISARAVWVANSAEGTVTRIDPRRDEPVATVRVGSGPGAIAVAGGAVWVANENDGTVSRIDPAANAVVATTPVGPSPATLAATAGGVWVGTADGNVALVERDSGRGAQTFALGGVPTALAVVGDRVWAAVQPAAEAHRGGTLVMTGAEPGPEPGETTASLDPAIAYSDRSWALLAVVADGLIGHRRAGGAAGAALVPDLAQTIPAPSDGGHTYRFQLRERLRYSTGAPVRASDVRASIERLHRMGSEAAASLPLGVHGEERCAPRRCDLSAGIEADDATGTVTFRLTRPNPDFLLHLARPIYAVLPAGTPDRDVTRDRLVGTGPYRISAATTPQEVVLERNPGFRAWSAAAQPNGYADRIVWKLTVPGARADPRADLAMDPGAETLRRLSLSAPLRVRSQPASALEFVWLNTRVPPFDRREARLAVAYATDRRALLRRHPTPPGLALRPTCQLIPPGFPAYEPYCPLATRPAAGSAAAASPDLVRARRLVRHSGTAGERVRFWSPADRPDALPLARAFVALLRRIGYDARLERSHPVDTDGPDGFYSWVADPRHRSQIGRALWYGETPSPANVIPPLLSCAALRNRGADTSNNPSQFCDQRIEAQMERAHALEAGDPATAERLWAAVDHALVDRAAIVPLFSSELVQATAPRVGGYQYLPTLGPLVAQAWVR